MADSSARRYVLADHATSFPIRPGTNTIRQPVWKAIYHIECQLDELDKLIDRSNLDKCFDCRQESKIACCYKTVSLMLPPEPLSISWLTLDLQYAESLIRLLVLISEKSEYLPGEVDKHLVTALNSLRAADYVRY